MHVIHDQPDAQLAVLVQRLGSPDAGIALEAVQALHRRLSTSNHLTATVAQLYAAGAAAALPRLLSSSDQALQCAVLQLLSFVAKHRKQKDPALEAALADELHAAVPALLGIFQRGQHSVHSAEAASAQAVGSLLCDLARLPSLWLAMAEHGAVAAAARQLQLGLLVPQAAGLLAKLARPAPGRQAVVTDGRLAAQQRRAAVAAGAIPALVQRLEAGGASHAATGGSEEVQQAAWALANLCQWCPEGQAAARREHTLPRLMHLAVHLSWQHGDSPDLPPLLAALASSNDWRHMERHGLPSCLRRLAASSNRTTRHRAAALLRWMEDASGADGYSSPDDLPPQQPPPQPPTPQQAQPPTKQQRPQLRLPQQAQPPPQQQAQPQPQQDAPPSTAGGRRRWRNRRRASQGATAGQVSAQAAGSSHLRAEQPRTAVPAPAAGTGRGTLGSQCRQPMQQTAVRMSRTSCCMKCWLVLESVVPQPPAGQRQQQLLLRLLLLWSSPRQSHPHPAGRLLLPQLWSSPCQPQRWRRPLPPQPLPPRPHQPQPDAQPTSPAAHMLVAQPPAWTLHCLLTWPALSRSSSCTTQLWQPMAARMSGQPSQVRRLGLQLVVHRLGAGWAGATMR